MLLAVGGLVLNLHVASQAGQPWLMVARHQVGSPSAHRLIQLLLASCLWPGPELDGREFQKGVNTGRCAILCEENVAPRKAWCIVILCPCRKDPGRSEVPEGLTEPLTYVALRAPAHFP